MGYHRAGFDVVGVDIEPQPHYPFEFVRADAMTVLDTLRDFCWAHGDLDAIHASPVCKRYANVTAWRGRPDDHPDQLQPTIDRLSAQRLPWVVENVPEALGTWDYLLCGSNFGLKVKRHRGFRRGNWTGYSLLSPCNHRGLMPFMHKNERAYADAMGCTWMSKEEARQAIPPAYTEYIGDLLMGALPLAA